MQGELPDESTVPAKATLTPLQRIMALGVEDVAHLLPVLAAIGAIVAFFCQPLLRYISAGELVGFVALFLAPAVWTLIVQIVSPKRLPLILILPPFVIAASLLLSLASKAAKTSAWNDRRCDMIQERMLRPTSGSRRDLPALFQALGCAPSGEEHDDPRYAPADKHGPPPSPAMLAAHERFLRRQLEAEVQLDESVAVPKAAP